MCCCLQLYTEYISNFDKALKLLEESCKKNRAFGELVKEFEVCAKNIKFQFHGVKDIVDHVMVSPSSGWL